MEDELNWPFISDENEIISQVEYKEELQRLDKDRIEYLQDIGLYPEFDRMHMTELYQAELGLSAHEAINIEVLSGRVTKSLIKGNFLQSFQVDPQRSIIHKDYCYRRLSLIG